MTNGSCNKADSSRRCACLEASEHHTDLPVCHVTIQITERASLDSLHRLPCFFRQRLWRRSPTRGEGRRITKAWCSNSPPPKKKKNSSGIWLRGRWVSFPQEGECGMCSVFEEGVLRVERVVAAAAACAFETVPDSTPPPPADPNSSKHPWLRDVYVA